MLVEWCDLRDAAVSAHACRALLSPCEVARAARFRRDLDRERFILRRAWLRQRLGSRVGERPERLGFVAEPRGKLRLPGSGVHFSASHSAGVALLASSCSAEVGADIEVHGLAPGCAQEASLFMSADDLAAYLDAPAHRRPVLYVDAWTRTEAGLKLTGGGLPELDSTASRPPEGAGRPGRVQHVHVLPGFSAAVGGFDPVGPLDVRRTRLRAPA